MARAVAPKNDMNIVSLKNNWLFRGAGALLLLWICVESAILIVYRETWFDELVYLFKGYVVVTGAFTPFRDIILEYPPLAFFVHGIVQAMVGPSMMAGRLTSGVFFGVLLLLTFFIGRNLGGRWAGLGAAALVMSHALLVANYLSAVPYALTVSFLLAALLLECFERHLAGKIFLSALLFAGMLLTRINMLPAVIIYGAYLFWIRKPRREIVAFWCVFLLAVAIGYLPTVIPDPALAVSTALSPFVSIGPRTILPASLKIGGVNLNKFLEIIASFFREYAATVAGAIAVVAALAGRGREEWKDFFAAERAYALLVAMAAGLLAAHYFYWRITGSVQYANFFMPLIALVLSVGAARYFKGNGLATALVGTIIVVNLLANIFPEDIASRPQDETDLERVRRGAVLVARHTAAQDRIIAFDNSIFHIFAAGRLTEPALINREFLYIGGIDRDTARRLRMYNPELLMTWLADADAVVVHEERWRQTFRRPFWKGERYDGEKVIADISSVLDGQYALVGSALNVYPRKYTEGNDGGTLLIYRRKK